MKSNAKDLRPIYAREGRGRISSPASESIVSNTANQVDGYSCGLQVIRMAVTPDSCQRRISGSDRINELVSDEIHESVDGRSHIVTTGTLHTMARSPSIPSNDQEISRLEDVKQATTLATDPEARPGMNAKIRVA